MKKIVIFGAGGHGKVVLDILLECGLDVEGFLDQDIKKTGQKISGHSILGDWSYLEKNKNVSLSLGIGNNIMRQQVFIKAKTMGFSIISAIHPKAAISRDTIIKDGAVIMANVAINPGTVVEEGVIVNTGATVDHDCILGKFSHICPGVHLAGTVTVGEFSSIGIGTAVKQNTNIGKYVIVGAGAAVVKDIPDNVTAVGIPAKIIKQHSV